MTSIPVTFDFKGKTYNGHLTQISGAGTSANFHLKVNGGYWGMLSYIEGHPGFNGGLHAVPSGWRFSSPVHPELSELTDHFGYVVQAWLDSHY